MTRASSPCYGPETRGPRGSGRGLGSGRTGRGAVEADDDRELLRGAFVDLGCGVVGRLINVALGHCRAADHVSEAQRRGVVSIRRIVDRRLGEVVGPGLPRQDVVQDAVRK